ncbi:hypothetical protein D3C81_1105890 [compost metagenome]
MHIFTGMGLAHRLEHEQRHYRGQCRHGGGHHEDRMPAARGGGDHAGERHQQRSRALGGVQQARVGRGKLRPEGVAAGGREQAVDLTPGKEHHACQYHEGNRMVAVLRQQQDADGLDAEGKEHGAFTADMIGDPAEERARQAVEHAVDGQCEGQRGQGQAKDRDRRLMQAEVLGDRTELGGGHQAAGGHHHEHRVHDPEDRRLQHLARRSVVGGGSLQRGLDLAQDLGGRREQGHAQDEHDQALAKTEPQERGFIARRLDHVGDGHDGQRGARAEPGRCDPCRQSPAIGEPLQRVAHASAIHRARAQAADCRRDVQHGQRRRHRVKGPGNGAQQAATHHYRARAVLVDEVALDRYQPGLRHDEDGECHLDRGAAPVVFIVDRVDEQRPAVLHVGDHRHADHAEDQLHPRRRKARRGLPLLQFHDVSL